MHAYLITGSGQYANVQMRLIAYHPADWPEADKLKVVLQAIERGHPIAEDPISVDYLTADGLDGWIEKTRLEGWEVSPSNMDARLREIQQERLAKDRVRYRKNYAPKARKHESGHQRT